MIIYSVINFYKIQLNSSTLRKRRCCVCCKMEDSRCSNGSPWTSHTSCNSSSHAISIHNVHVILTLSSSENGIDWLSMEIVDKFMCTLTGGIDSASWLSASIIREKICLSNWFLKSESSSICVYNFNINSIGWSDTSFGTVDAEEWSCGIEWSDDLYSATCQSFSSQTNDLTSFSWSNKLKFQQFQNSWFSLTPSYDQWSVYLRIWWVHSHEENQPSEQRRDQFPDICCGQWCSLSSQRQHSNPLWSSTWDRNIKSFFVIKYLWNFLTLKSPTMNFWVATFRLTVDCSVPIQPWMVNRVGCAALKLEFWTDAKSLNKRRCPVVGLFLV